MPAFSKICLSDWIGIDFSEAEPVACSVSKTFFGGRKFRQVDPERIREARPDGARCAAAVPVDKIFTEKIVVDGVPKRKASEFVLGKLDISLPVPVEECIVEVTEIKDEDKPSFTAYALPMAAYDACRAEISAAAGVSPEALVPAAAAIWEFLKTRYAAFTVTPQSSGAGRAVCPHTAAVPGEPRPRIHISASSRQWFIAAGRASLENVVSIPVGDTAALLRNIAIISMRFESPLITASGSCADKNLAESLALAGYAVSIAASPADFLARAIAYSGLQTHSRAAVNFNTGANAHPAAIRFACENAFFAIFWLVLLAALYLAFNFHDYTCAREKLAAAETKLTATAEQLAGRSLGVEPLVAIELAKNEFAKKLNPDVEAFTKHDATGALAAAVKFAADNAVAFTKITIEDSVLTLESDKMGSAKIRELGTALSRSGFTMSVADGAAFRAVIKPAEGGADE